MELFFGICVFLFGMIIGSFLNVCILRLPESRSIITGPSSCPACGTQLTARDLVPVFSYIFLRGKCRHCGKRISAQYPLVELMAGVLFLLLYVKFGLAWQLPVNAALVSILIVVALIDWRHMEIPNGLVIALLVLGAVQLAATIFTGVFGNWTSYVIGMFAGGLPLLLIALICQLMLKKEAFGGGDVKLMAAAGLVIGWKLVITSYAIGIISGAVFGVILLLTGSKKREDAMPFGPFLALGITASVFFGNDLINWYLGLI
jgi:leader peptidase (prepilin peptidase)/N-methyltransferase